MVDNKDLKVLLATFIRLSDVDSQADLVTKHPELMDEVALSHMTRMYEEAHRRRDKGLQAQLERTEKLLRLAGQLGVELASSMVKAGSGSGMIIDNTAVPFGDDEPR